MLHLRFEPAVECGEVSLERALQLHYPALEGAGHHTLAQQLEAAHLGFHQRAAVVAAPLLPDRPAQALGRVHRHRRFIVRDLPEQFGQHRRVAHVVGSDIDGPDLQRVRVDAQVNLAPLALGRRDLRRRPSNASGADSACCSPAPASSVPTGPAGFA